VEQESHTARDSKTIVVNKSQAFMLPLFITSR
jgi:hypothetical protein